MYSCIVVEDEQNDLELLLNLLQPYDQIKIVDTAIDIESAIAAITYHKPDLVFLDVDLYGRKSFDVLDVICKYNLNPIIVFTTAYSEYMKDAIKYSAFDYILKPIDIDELNEVIQRLEQKKQSMDLKQSCDKFSYAKSNLVINNTSGFEVLKLQDVVMLKAAEGYTDIYLINNKIVTSSKKIGEFESNIPSDSFFRSHRSYIINIAQLVKVDKKKCLLKTNDRILEADITKDSVKLLQQIVSER